MTFLGFKIGQNGLRRVLGSCLGCLIGLTIGWIAAAVWVRLLPPHPPIYVVPQADVAFLPVVLGADGLVMGLLIFWASDLRGRALHLASLGLALLLVARLVTVRFVFGITQWIDLIVIALLLVPALIAFVRRAIFGRVLPSSQADQRDGKGLQLALTALVAVLAAVGLLASVLYFVGMQLARFIPDEPLIEDAVQRYGEAHGWDIDRMEFRTHAVHDPYTLIYQYDVTVHLANGAVAGCTIDLLNSFEPDQVECGDAKLDLTE